MSDSIKVLAQRGRHTLIDLFLDDGARTRVGTLNVEVKEDGSTTVTSEPGAGGIVFMAPDAKHLFQCILENAGLKPHAHSVCGHGGTGCLSIRVDRGSPFGPFGIIVEAAAAAMTDASLMNTIKEMLLTAEVESSMGCHDVYWRGIRFVEAEEQDDGG